MATFEAVLVAESGGARRRVYSDVDQCSHDYVDFGDEEERKNVIEAVGEVDLIIGLIKLYSNIAEQVDRVGGY
jgi:hypothetical protein